MNHQYEEKVICVDDDPNVLDAFERLFRRKFETITCPNPRLALNMISSRGPFALIVSDMRMPDIDGVKFLTMAADISPESVRIMLTGVQDQQTAIDAVNEGKIFRFLSKPCAPELLLKTVMAGIEQYRLVTSEHVLLHKTLLGSIRMLTDILSLTNPAAFSRAMRLRKYASHTAEFIHTENVWQVEAAAMLSQTGYVTVPAEILEKHAAGEKLSDIEHQIITGAHDISANILANIPRLDSISGMIRNQHKPFNFFKPSEHMEIEELGGQILKACHDFDLLICRGYSRETAIEQMEKNTGDYNPATLIALRAVQMPKIETAIRMVKIKNLKIGMILSEDIRAKNGLLVVPAGHEVNTMLQRRLENFLLQKQIPDEIRVSIPV